MASAEKLLHDAQYAFASITYGESRANRRNRARATTLCRKIMRKYPGSMEAAEAFAILQRLGQEAYLSELPARHRHITGAQHHGKTPPPVAERTVASRATGSDETLDWGGLLGLLLVTPKIVLGFLALFTLFLFLFLGPLLVVPLLALALFTGPFRSMLKKSQREQANEFIARANAWIDQRRHGGGGFS
jgi:hypothetical protein